MRAVTFHVRSERRSRRQECHEWHIAQVFARAKPFYDATLGDQLEDDRVGESCGSLARCWTRLQTQECVEVMRHVLT